MREIEFRAKKFICGKRTNEWEYGVPLMSNPNSQLAYIKQLNSYEYQVDPETIGQYTGLTDKNGTKIFEGDIVKYTRTNMYAPTTSFHNQDLISLHRIYWNDEKHCFYEEDYKLPDKKCIGGGRLDFDDGRADENIIEVIGNIYDNPELLPHQHEDKGENFGN